MTTDTDAKTDTADATGRYVRTLPEWIPERVRWDTPQRYAGQFAEVAYGGYHRAAKDVGDPYMMVLDEERVATFYRWVEGPDVHLRPTTARRLACGLSTDDWPYNAVDREGVATHRAWNVTCADCVATPEWEHTARRQLADRS